MQTEASTASAGTVNVLVTDNGTHPPEKWAKATADEIIDASSVAVERAAQAEQLRDDIIAVLEKYHRQNIEDEQDRLALGLTGDSEDLWQQAQHSVIELGIASPWHQDFSDPDKQASIGRIIDLHFRLAQDVERQWYAGHHSDPPVIEG